MKSKLVKELMVPLEMYPTVPQDSTLLDAVNKFERVQKLRDRRRQPYRAILVVDENNNVVGKIGQLAFLRALEPQRNVLGDMGKLAIAGVSADFINTMMNHFQFFQDSMADICRRARHIIVKDVMVPVTESIEEEATLGEAIYKIVALQTLSIMVTRKGKIVGLLRLCDVVQEIADEMKHCDEMN